MKSELRFFWVFILTITGIAFLLGAESVGIGGYGVLCVMWVCGAIVTICVIASESDKKDGGI